jgi:hypothetical protein
MKAGQGLCHQGLLGVVSACQCHLLSHNGVAHRFYPYQAKPPVNVSSCAMAMSLAGI